MKNSTQIVKKIITSGGVTFNPFWMDDDGHYLEPKEGYCVALAGHTFRVKNQNIIDEFSVEQAVNNFVVKNAERLENRHLFVGIFYDDGDVLIELTKVVLEPDKAYLDGYRQDQNSIYDIEQDKVVYLINPQKAGTMSQKSAYMHQCADNFKKSRS